MKDIITELLVKFEVFRTEKFWASYWGLLTIIMVIMAVFLPLDFLINIIDKTSISFLQNKKILTACILYVGISLSATYIWARIVKRIYFRDSFLVRSIVTISSALLSWAICYGTKYCLFRIWDINIDTLPYIITISVLTIIILFFVSDIETRLCRKKQLLICIAINNVDNNSIGAINNSLVVALDKIRSQYSDVDFILLPYDLYNHITKYERYINRPFAQIDALIYANIINDEQGGYIFANLSSRINVKKIKHKNDNELLNNVLGFYLSEKEWNKINNDQELVSRIKISNNLYEMLLLYVSCVYLIKKELPPAINISREIYNFYLSQYGDTPKLIANLFSFALLTNILSAESQHNYTEAIKHINECLRYFPVLEKSTFYQMLMARIYYYLGDIPKSKRYTQAIKSIDQWGYSLNMGFYAILDGKIPEFIQHYKRLLTKQKPPHKENVLFAINFLKYEKTRVNDNKVKAILKYAISLLDLYINHKRSKRNVSLLQYNGGLSKEEKKALSWASNLIQEIDHNLLT